MSNSRLSKHSNNSFNRNIHFPKGRLQTLKVSTDDPNKIADLRAQILRIEKRKSREVFNRKRSKHRVSVLTPRGDIIEHDNVDEFPQDLPSVKGKFVIQSSEDTSSQTENSPRKQNFSQKFRSIFTQRSNSKRVNKVNHNF